MGLITKYRMSFLPPSKGMPYTKVPNTTPLATDPSVAAAHTTAPLDELQQVNSRNQTPDELKTQRLNKFLKNRLNEDKAKSMVAKQAMEAGKQQQANKAAYNNSLLGRYNNALNNTSRLWAATGNTLQGVGGNSIRQQRETNKAIWGDNSNDEHDGLSYEDKVARWSTYLKNNKGQNKP